MLSVENAENPASGLAIFEETLCYRVGGGTRATRHPDLGVDIVEVTHHRAAADYEPLSDLWVAQVGGQEAEHLDSRADRPSGNAELEPRARIVANAASRSTSRGSSQG